MDFMGLGVNSKLHMKIVRQQSLCKRKVSKALAQLNCLERSKQYVRHLLPKTLLQLKHRTGIIIHKIMNLSNKQC